MVKKLIAFFLTTCSLILAAEPVSAHLAGQPPYFRINGVFSILYPLPQDSYIGLNPFPQDMAPAVYSINIPIEFAFDTEALSKIVPLEIINKTIFIWDFGDGTDGRGQKNSHVYKKPGSYVVSITADTRSFEPNAEPQVIQSVLLHTVENEAYVLPKTQIVVNGKEGKNINSDWLEVNLKKPIAVEGIVIQEGTTPIVSYTWDFGDGTTKDGQNAAHGYETPPPSVMVILRTIDEKGFIVDSSVGLVDNPSLYSALNNPATSSIESSSSNIQVIVVIFAGLACIIGLFIFLRKNSSE